MPVRHHREQSQSNRCVPACVAMVLSWLGRPADEDEICRNWVGSKRGYAIGDAAHRIEGQLGTIYPDDARFYDYLTIRLEESRWIIAYVFSKELMDIAEAFASPPRSRYGRLTNEPFGDLHAVVLVGTAERDFLYLDPYYPAAGQPFRLSRTQLARVWQGTMAVSPPLDV